MRKKQPSYRRGTITMLGLPLSDEDLKYMERVKEVVDRKPQWIHSVVWSRDEIKTLTATIEGKVYPRSRFRAILWKL